MLKAMFIVMKSSGSKGAPGQPENLQLNHMIEISLEKSGYGSLVSHHDV
jgi:hypothetical protein